MGNPKLLSSSGAKQAAEENGYKDEHDFKTSQGYGRSEADMCVDIDSDEIVLRPTGTSSTAVIETGMYTKARWFVCSTLLNACCLRQVFFVSA